MADARRALTIDWIVQVGHTKVTFSGPWAEERAKEYAGWLERDAKENPGLTVEDARKLGTAIGEHYKRFCEERIEGAGS